MKIAVPKYLGMSDMPKFIADWQDVVNAFCCDTPITLNLDLSEIRFTRTTPIAVIAAIISGMQRKNLIYDLKVDTPRNQDCHQYLARMDFYAMLEQDYQFSWCKRSASGRFRELVEVDSEEKISEVSKDIAGVLAEQCLLDENTKHSLEFVLSEIMDNVFHHAQSPINAFVCAQSYTKQKKVEIAIVDLGRGFQASLMGNPSLHGKFEDACSAISLATQVCVTGRPDHNTGLGLSYTHYLAKRHQCDMIVYSDEGMLNIRKGQESMVSAPRWNGTIVGLRIDTRQKINMGEIGNEIYPLNHQDQIDDLFDIS